MGAFEGPTLSREIAEGLRSFRRKCLTTRWTSCGGTGSWVLIPGAVRQSSL